MTGVDQNASDWILGQLPEKRHKDFIVVTFGDGEVPALGAHCVVEQYLHAIDQNEVLAVFRVERDARARDIAFGATAIARLARSVTQAELSHRLSEVIIGRGCR